MAEKYTFLDLQKEYAQKNGMLQNGSITGMNADMIDLMKKDINREMQNLADMHPPWFNTKKRIYFVSSTALRSASTTYTATGSKGIPRIIDSSKRLKARDLFCNVSNGTFNHRLIGVSGTTYDLSHPLLVAATTGTLITAYRDAYPLPHDMGQVTHAYYESDECPITLANSRAEYDALSARNNTGSRPLIAGVDVFTNDWYAYKNRETSVTVTNGSRVVTVADANIGDIGDVATLTVGTTISLHTVTGRDTTNNQFYLDRDFSGTSGGATLELNPKQYTSYISFYYLPTTEDEIVLTGWIKPPDMVYDTDVCPFPSHLIPIIVIGALMRSKLSMEMLTDQWIAYYQKVIKELRVKKKANWSAVRKPPNWTGTWGDEYPSFVRG